MVTPVEAAEIIGVSIATFRRRVKDGTIPLPRPETGPFLKRPRRILYNRADVMALKEKNASSPPSSPV